MPFADNIKSTLAHKSHEGKHYWSNTVHSHWASITNTYGAEQPEKGSKKLAVNMAVWTSLAFSLGNEFTLGLHVPQSVR